MQSISWGVMAIALVFLCLPGNLPGGKSPGAQAAIQDKSQALPQISRPKTQRKIAVNQTKTFENNTLSVTVLTAGRTSADVAVNDIQPVNITIGALTLVDIGGDTICTLTYLGKSGTKGIVAARCDPANEDLRAALNEQNQSNEDKVAVISPLEVVENAARGDLKNPYTGNQKAIAEGRNLFLANSCNGCHGGTGGGGMGPPLSNAVWVYGADDDTLFRLITQGSDELQAVGYSRVAREKVVGPMPGFGDIIEDDQHVWKIIAFIRSIYNDDPSKKTW